MWEKYMLSVNFENKKDVRVKIINKEVKVLIKMVV